MKKMVTDAFECLGIGATGDIRRGIQSNNPILNNLYRHICKNKYDMMLEEIKHHQGMVVFRHEDHTYTLVRAAVKSCKAFEPLRCKGRQWVFFLKQL